MRPRPHGAGLMHELKAYSDSIGRYCEMGYGHFRNMLGLIESHFQDEEA